MSIYISSCAVIAFTFANLPGIAVLKLSRNTARQFLREDNTSFAARNVRKVIFSDIDDDRKLLLLMFLKGEIDPNDLLCVINYYSYHRKCKDAYELIFSAVSSKCVSHTRTSITFTLCKHCDQKSELYHIVAASSYHEINHPRLALSVIHSMIYPDWKEDILFAVQTSEKTGYNAFAILLYSTPDTFIEYLQIAIGAALRSYL